ncbi:hypothetical protein EV182_003147 [Spiromyces aspiralis]|uniref:Uncharacterized protein n=1 Tax=Spiromyces aspiralis TaxID=68401 RepID=A0ACC1HD69_9FUNG|nr:hypothetical protein EV182_003147 [Spiromyces aspiralis]
MQSDEPLPPIMNAHEKYKQMRARKDVAAVATRWQFSDQPRPELVNLLHAQTEGHLNNDIRGKLFSSGHYKDRDYLAGLSALDDVLSIPGYSEDRYGIPTAEMRSRYIAHSDLILKYISLRLYDSQTHTLSKCLDLLEHLLGVMEEVGNDDRYQQVIGLTDYEAHCILPHLIVQLGNGKEQIRSRVRRVIIGQMTHLYPVTKIFQMLLEHGLRASKNSRVRQEALDSMAYFVRERSAGLGLGGVCAMPAKTVPVIASAISDRDANVRNAALNCLVEISGNVPGGEGDLWRLIGRLPERERSMLEEKLRHNGSGSASVGSRSSSRMSGSIGGGGSVGRMASIRPPLAGGSSGLRPPSRTAGTLQRGGLGSLHPHRLPPTTGGNSADQYQSQYPTRSQAAASGGHPRPYNLDLDRLELPSYSSHVKPSLTTAPRTTSPSAVGPGIDEYHHQDQTSAPSPSEEQWIEGIIADLSGDDPRAVVDALDQLQQFLSEKSSDTQGLVVRHINDLLPAVRLQMRWAFATTTDPESASPLHATLNRLRKATVGTLIDVFKGDSRLGKHANEESVSQVLDELLRRLVDPVLTESTTSDAPLIEDALQLTKAMNSLVMRILENADRTTVYCTLVGMLENAMAMRIPTEGQTPTQRHHAKYGDLVMRCLWRISKHLRDEVTKSPKPALRYGELLPLTHRFFARLPDSEWRQREERKCLYGDLPKRTIKTINHAIATGLGGGDIWDYMSGVAAMVCAEDPSVLRRLGQLGQQRATRALSDSDWAGEVHDVLSESSETYAYIRHVLQDKFSPSVGQVEGILAGVSGLGLGSSSGSALRRGMPAFSSVMDSISSPAKGAGSVGGGPMGNISPLRSSNSNSTSTSNGGPWVKRVYETCITWVDCAGLPQRHHVLAVPTPASDQPTKQLPLRAHDHKCCYIHNSKCG